ncbi:MAG: hypothetical protein GY934_19440 [Gammaproteobacteria bacterium]|nr:hypothetical protein [Gammaproteobacteria bacterium]
MSTKQRVKTILVLCCVFTLMMIHSAASAQTPEGYVVTDERPQQGRAGVEMNARATWRLNDYQDYVYRLEQACYCVLPKVAKVYVVAGRVVQVEDLKTGRVHREGDMLRNFHTVSALLELIDKLVARHPDNMSVRYNRHLGYPELIKIDQSYRMADEEIDYRVLNLKFLRRR